MPDSWHFDNEDITDAFVNYLHLLGVNPVIWTDEWYPDATDEQRAEFLAHVAHTIGYDLESDIHNFDAYFGEGSELLAAYYKQQSTHRFPSQQQPE